ncbi:MAG TPA: carboxypeptidase-like regulatory domain-containing protein [Longimicrobiales bacterium]
MTIHARLPVSISAILAFSLFITACGGSGGGGGGPIETPQFGTLTGTVRESAGQSVVPNATVAVGTASTTTAATGRFTLQNVPLGAGNISVTAVGFDAYSQAVTVQSGTNNHDVALTRKSIYASGAVTGLLSPTIPTFRGILFLLAGSTQDSRPFIRGEPGCWSSQNVQLGTAVCDPGDFRQRLLALAQQHGLALFGARTAQANGIAAYDELISGIASVAAQSGRSELANAPILLVGSSLGGCIAHGFTRVHTARSIGFITAKGACHTGGASPAQAVPGYLFIGEDDPVSPDAINQITQLFNDNRTLGAPWALAIEQGSGHEFPRRNDAIFRWLEAVLTRRLPSSHVAGTPLPAVNAATGWLANRATGVIGAETCFASDKSVASWLPTEATARDWQTFVGSTAAVGCN